MKKNIIVKKNEKKVIPIVWINGKEKEIEIEASLVGEDSSLELICLFFGNSKNVVFNTNIVHQGLNSFSRTVIRGVFKQYSSFDNDGLVRIEKGAKGADGFFSSKILLFDDAKGRSVPSLEIDENELKAGHASTVGRPDEEQLFYLRSRGLSEKEAERLIISGFFSPLIDRLSEKEQKTIRRKLQPFL